jgi:beta-lactamase class A
LTSTRGVSVVRGPVVAALLTGLLLAGLLVSPGATHAEPTVDDPCGGAAPTPFDDREVVATVHREAIDCLWQLGVLQGELGGDGLLRVDPQVEVTRGQLAGLVHRLLEQRAPTDLTDRRRPRFDDVPAGHTFDEAIHALAAVDVIRGVDERRFDPGAPVRRDQVASLLVRSAAFASGRSLEPVGGPYYLDVGTGTHRGTIDAGFEFGLVTGVRHPCGEGLGRFGPTDPAQRQQTATILVRLLRSLDAIEAGTQDRAQADPDCPALRWIPDPAVARGYLDLRAGQVSIAAIGTDGQLIGHRADTPVAAASVLKVMFMVAYLRQPDVRDRALGPADRALLEPMIRRSADQPATDIADLLGPQPIEALAARAGMRDFAYTRPWGLTRTSARDQARFMLELDRHLPERHRTYALQLLRDIDASQRWGIGQVDTPGWTAQFKGGWGARTGAVNHQVVRLEHRDGTVVAVAVMTTSNRDHDDGSATLEGVFARLLADLP